jgi:carbon monoxide dehydrogenase subunit G
MTRLHRTITVSTPIEEAFDYVADFANTAEWDPGVARASLIKGDAPGLGAEYSVTAVFNGREIPMTYRTTGFERPERVELVGESLRLTAVDEIRFAGEPDGRTRIDYSAVFTLKGLLRFAQPFLKGAFDKLADAALDGMAARLSR